MKPTRKNIFLAVLSILLLSWLKSNLVQILGVESDNHKRDMDTNMRNPDPPVIRNVTRNIATTTSTPQPVLNTSAGRHDKMEIQFLDYTRYVEQRVRLADVFVTESAVEDEKASASIPLCQYGSLEEATIYENRQTFIPIGDRAYVYSAYYDARIKGKESVRGIGFRDFSNVTCILWFGLEHCQIVNATEIGLHYRPGGIEVSYICDVSQWSSLVPDYVTFIKQAELSNISTIRNALRLENTLVPIRNQHNVSVCVHSPLYANYSNVHQFIEFVEVYMMLGVTNIAVYNSTASSVLRPVIGHYVKQGVMDLASFRKPAGVRRTSHQSQLTLIQECLQRYIYKTKYLILVDLDELVFPGKNDTILEMMEASPCRDSAATRFETFSFNLDFPPNPTVAKNTTVTKLQPISLLYTERVEATCCFKYIVQPIAVQECEIHVVSHFLEKVHWKIPMAIHRCRLPIEHGYVHHYRKRGNLTSKVPGFEAHRFFDKIVERLQQKHRALNILP